MPSRSRKQRRIIPPNAPKYETRELKLILRFLAGLTLDTMYAIKGLTEFGVAPNAPDHYRRCMQYHTGRIDMLRHMAIRAANRQRHLLEMSEEQFQEIIKAWSLPSKTLSSLEQSGIFATMQTQNADVP